MIKRTCILIILTLGLSACVPAAFVAGAGASSVVINDKRAMATMMEDRNIANTALIKISHDQQLKQQTHISVIVFNHIVLMVGQAPTAELRDRAYALVNSVPKIKRIYDQVTIEPSISDIASANDSWLTTKVKSAMLAEKGLDSGQIKVTTENGVVYLMGIVSRRQADLAASVASGVEGVQKVVKIFEYD